MYKAIYTKQKSVKMSTVKVKLIFKKIEKFWQF